MWSLSAPARAALVSSGTDNSQPQYPLTYTQSPPLTLTNKQVAQKNMALDTSCTVREPTIMEPPKACIRRGGGEEGGGGPEPKICVQK